MSEIKESIEINNFGPILHLKLDEISPMTIFVGKSGSGKSTILKVVALFQWIYKMMSIRSYLYYSGIKRSPFRFKFSSLVKANGMESFLKDETEIIYTRGNISISYKNKQLLGTKDVRVPKEELSVDKMSFISDKRNMIPDLWNGNIPTRKEMFYLNETYEDYKKATEAIKQFELESLGVKLLIKKTAQGLKNRIVPMNEAVSYEIDLSEASSGTQNMAPLNMIVEYYSKYYDLVSSMNKSILYYLANSDRLKDFKAVANIGDFKHKRVRLFIEEPEISLYPRHQRDLMDFLVDRCFVSKQQKYEMSLMIATHSPYIVNQLNLLIKRYEKMHKGAAISYENLSVYKLENGTLTSLKVENAHLVNTDILSDDINEIYEEYNEIDKL